MKILINTAFVLVLLAGCGGGSDSNKSSNSNQTNNETFTIEQLLTKSVEDGLDGIWVYAQQGESAAMVYQAGVQDRIQQTPASSGALFKIASISKLFIAVSVVKLHHQQLLSLDDSLALWLPELADRIEHSDQITVSLLVQHRSGIPDFDSQQGFSWENAHSDVDDTLALALDKPADFAPNATYEYSNTNYLLLAKILDNALGYDHSVFIKEQILAPLELANTFVYPTEIDLSLLAKGYWHNIDRSAQVYMIPGGSMIATIEDVGRFIRALNTGMLLSEQERATYSDVYSFNHSGWLPGYQSIARYYQAKDLVLVQFINSTGGASEQIATSTFDAVYQGL